MNNKQPLRGINLGGWLIPEPWLTPAVFASTDTHDLHSLLQSKRGREAYLHHIETFITKHDFDWLHDQSIELIRLPIGYWNIESEEPYIALYEKIDWVMQQAAQRNIRVLLDLHGAPGSQNGYNHSGRQGNADWWRNRTYRQRTLKIIRDIGVRYGSSPALWGIEILNEPRMPWWGYGMLLRFYRTTYRELRTVLKPGTWIIFHDAFHPILLTGSLKRQIDYPVALDIHWYGFPTQRVKTIRFTTYLRLQTIYLRALVWWVGLWQPVIIGEWSAVAPQDYMERSTKEAHPTIWHKNGTQQQQAFRHRSIVATCYWTYKGQGRGVWHGRSLHEDDILSL